MELMELLMTRRTYRRFDQSRQIPQEVIDEMLEAARISPSSCNMQPLHYYVVKSPDKVEEIFTMTHWAVFLPKESGHPKKGEHPVLFVLVTYNTHFKNKYTDTDAGLAIGNMTLSAWTHGVGSCIMGNVDQKNIKRTFGLSEDTILHSVIAFGYPTHSSRIVPVQEDDNTHYFLDENKDYCVPKRAMEKIVTYI